MANQSTKFRFTDRAVEKLPAHPSSALSKAAQYSDQQIPQLKLEVSKLGTKVFRLRYVFREQRRNYRIGQFPATDVAAARQRALEMLALLDQDKDPQDERNRLRALPTLAEFARTSYLPWAQLYKRSYRADESKLRNHVIPRFGDRRLDSITAMDVTLYHGEVRRSHCAATANRHLALLSKLFRLAVDDGLVAENPCERVKQFKEENQRQRFLSTDELRRLLAAMEAESNKVAAAALQLLLLTGMRRQEALEARWEHVDLESGVLFLPRTKNGRGRYVPLNDEAKALLAAQPSRGASTWVFPGKDPAKPLSNVTKPFLRILERAGIAHMRIHDLRHSFASLAVNAGASLYQVQHLLGHSSPAMAQRYSHLGDTEQRQVSQSVGDLVRRATGADAAA